MSNPLKPGNSNEQNVTGSTPSVLRQKDVRRDMVSALSAETQHPIAIQLPSGIAALSESIGTFMTKNGAKDARRKLKANEYTPEEAALVRLIARPEYPATGVDEHLDAHHDLVDRLVEGKKISPKTAAFLRIFVERHDSGYRSDLKAVFEGNAEKVKGVFRDLCAMLGTPDRSALLFDFIVNNQEPQQYLVGKVLCHGVAGFALNVLWLEEQGISRDEALATAGLIAAHHPGFPISSLVADKLLKWDAFATDKHLPKDFRKLLLIDDAATIAMPGAGNPQETWQAWEEAKGQSADALRTTLIDQADQRGFNRDAAVQTVAMGFGLDRMVPGNFIEIFKKKYPLVVGNVFMLNMPRTLESLFTQTMRVLRDEAQTAIATAKRLGVDAATLALLESLMEEELTRRESEQNAALAFTKTIPGFSGTFEEIGSDLHLAERIYSSCATLNALTPGMIDKAKAQSAETLYRTLLSIQPAIETNLNTQIVGIYPQIKQLNDALPHVQDDNDTLMLLKSILQMVRIHQGQNDVLTPVVKEPGDVLLEKDARNKDIYILVSGVVEVTPAGQQTLSIAGPTILGEFSAINHLPTRAEVRLPREGPQPVILRMDCSLVQNLVHDPATGLAVSAIMAKRQRP